MRHFFVLTTVMLLISSAGGSWAQTLTPPITRAVEAVPADFVIGPEDVLGILVWREPDVSGDVTVRSDGKITLPLVGEITAGGLRPEELRQELQKAAGRFVADANVTVVVRQINSRKVFITGEVAHPGAFPLIGPRSVLQLIALAGGLTEYANGDDIRIMRTERGRTQALKFNYKDVVKGKRLEQNVQLQPGDITVVP